MAADELKVRMTLQDEYTAKMKQAHAATRQFGQSVQQTQTSLLQLGQGASSGSFSGFSQGVSGLSNAFKGLLQNMNPVTLGIAALFSVFVGGAIAIGALVTGLAALTIALKPIFEQAVGAALNMERLTMTFVALGNSAAEAKAKMSWLKTFATTSIGEFKDIAEAAVQLEAFGLRAEHFIPIISNMAGAFGGTREQILSVAGALGRMTSGTFGEAMEVLKNFGIGKADLIKVGIKITGGGEIKATVEQMLSAIEKIAGEKFGGIATVMGATLGVKLSNLADGWNSILASLGTGFLPVVKTIVDAITPMLAFMASQAKEIGTQFSNMLLALFSDMGGASFIETIGAWILAIMTNLPALISQAIDAIKITFNAFTSGVEGFINSLGSGLFTVVNLVSQAIYDLRLAIAKIGDEAESKLNPLGNTTWRQDALGKRPDQMQWQNQNFGQMGASLTNAFSGGAFGDIAKEKDNYLKKLAEFKNQPGGTAGAVSDKYNKNFTAVPDALSVIANNTGDTASNTKALREAAEDYAFGGGDLASRGISKVSMRRGTRNLPVKVKIEGGTDAVTRLFEQMVNKVLMAHQATNGGF